jgi:precorrin-6B methylase 2
MRLILAVVCAALSAGAAAQEMFSPFVGTQPENVERMIRIAKIRPGNTVIDLGAGDGRIVFAAAKMHPGIRGLGVDIDAKLVGEANEAARQQGMGERVRFLHKNVFDADLRNVDVIFMWLFPELQRLLRTKILAEARPGTRVVTNIWDMGTWSADEVDEEGNVPVRSWIVPAKLAGNWNWSLVLRGRKYEYAAVLEQQFQKVEGVVRVADRRRVMHDFKLVGEELSFSALLTLDGIGYARHQFSGRVGANTMSGKALVYHPKRDDPDEYQYTEVQWRAARSARSAYFAETGLTAR